MAVREKRVIKRSKASADFDSSSDTSASSHCQRPSDISDTDKKFKLFQDYLLTSLTDIEDPAKREGVRLDIAKYFFSSLKKLNMDYSLSDNDGFSSDDDVTGKFAPDNDEKHLKIFVKFLTAEIRRIKDKKEQKTIEACLMHRLQGHAKKIFRS